MKRVIKRRQTGKQSRRQTGKQSRRQTGKQSRRQTGKQKKNNKNLLKHRVKKRIRIFSRSKKQTKLRSKLRSKKFNSRIKSIFKRSLKKKQRGGNTSKTCTNSTSFLSAKGRGSITNTLDNINNVGGQFATDSYLQTGNSIGNLYNNLVGQNEIMSPSVTEQPLSY